MTSISICPELEIPKTTRDNKGKSIIRLLNRYCVIDIETTGLCPGWDEIIEIGAVKYSNGEIIDQFQTLVQPPINGDAYINEESGKTEWVDAYITKLTGISNEMLADAPCTEDVIKEFADFLGDDIIVGYNVSFDVNFLYDSFVKYSNRPLSNDYIDVMRMARKLYRDMEHHRLKDMIRYFGLEQGRAHRAVNDCEATESCYRKISEEAIKQFGTETAFIESFISKKKGRFIKAKDICSDESKIDEDSPIYNKRCVFTGKLEKFTRKEAMQIVADIGGINEDGVTQKTNFLILGDNDYCTTIKGGKSSKQKKAEKYKLNGQDIEIIPETVFYDMIGDCEI